MLKYLLQSSDDIYYSSDPGISTAAIIVMVVVAILVLASVWRVYEKAGQPGWAAIIPIYNLVVMQRIIGKPWWWVLLMFIPIVNLVFAVWQMNLLSKSFGKGEGFTLGLIFLGFIFYPILAWGNSSYLGPQSKEALDAKQAKLEFERNQP